MKELLEELAAQHRLLNIATGKDKPTLYSRAGEAIHGLLKRVDELEKSVSTEKGQTE